VKKKENSFPIATAMRAALADGYDLGKFRHDLIAGLIVSLIALPLAMALSIAVGLPPQHGIYTAIVAGIAAALLGGSITQVSGPTAAFVVIVAPIVSEYGLHGLIWCQIMAGAMLIILGTARLGRYINYVPYPVTTGFTAGIAVVIATLALNDFFGLGLGQLKGEFVEKVAAIATHLSSANIFELGVGLTTLLVILFFDRISRAVPSPIVGVLAGTAVAYLMARYGHEIATIGNRFTYEAAEGLGHGIPPYPPVFHWPSFEPGTLLSLPTFAEFKRLLMPSMTIAALAALESLLSATIADSMAGTRHDPNAELNGIGIGNILSGLVGGIPATGAIARTSVNVHSGAKTPLASVFHALFILLYVLLLAPLISYIPLASLAALLLVAAYRMSHVRQFLRTIKIAHTSDIAVLLTCFLLTVFVDMVAGVFVGIVLAAFLFMKRISELTDMKFAPSDEKSEDGRSLRLPDNVIIYRIDGPLFFGTVEKAYDRYNFVHDHVDTLIIDMERVPLIDMTGLVAMKSMLTSIAREGRTVILCGRRDITDQIMLKIEGSKIAKYVRVVSSVSAAII
jgi:SulP family sulfate permease